jgi:hypothetical protein
VPSLVLGPLLRFVSRTEAVVWVETDAPCEVEVLGHRSATFRVQAHHYGLVAVHGLAPATTTPYEVRLDGALVWPEPESPFPPSSIRTLGGERVRVVFASCRTAAPHEPPWTLSPDRDGERGRELDALWAYARRMRTLPREEWPDLALMLGDQVYADEVSPRTREFIRRRRDTSVPPHEEVADFTEYAMLYRESWSDPVVRWFLSTIPTAMIFDDHDVHDDWNISVSWIEEYRRKPWWDRRIVAALASYWLYQHLGNLPIEELERDELFRRVHDVEDAWSVLEPWARRADRETDGARWSYARDLDRSRLIVIDSRAGRLPEGRREMVDEDEWRWIEERARGDVDHLLLATSLPWLLPHGPHGLEAWSEAVCGGAWGNRFEPIAERIRRRADLEHWPAFGASFAALERLVLEVARGQRGRAPSTLLVLGGDVHYSYLAPVQADALESRVYEITCSPLRNPLPRRMRNLGRFAASRVGAAIGTALARAARVRRPEVRWRLESGPWFDNVIATLDLHGADALLDVEHTSSGSPQDPRLETLFRRDLARR